MKLDGKTRVFGLFGDPVEHSLSPIIQNAGFHAAKLNCCYLPFKVARENLTASVQAITALNVSGVNVTAPHKETITSLLHNLSQEAALLGAVNTIKNEKHILLGFNTDVEGFTYLLKRNVRINEDKKEYVCMLGAGGAAKAVSLALSNISMTKLVIANRTARKAEELAELLLKHNKITRDQINLVPLNIDVLNPFIQRSTILINALSNDPWDWNSLRKMNISQDGYAIDLRYKPIETSFLSWTKKNGAKGINGLDMLLGQGIKAFEIFTGKKAPVSAMEEALSGALN